MCRKDEYLFFLPDLNGGGAERALLNLLKYWPIRSLENCKLTLVLRQLDGAYINDLPKYVEVIGLNCPRNGLKAYVLTVFKLRQILKTRTPTIVIAFLSLPSVFTAFRLSRINTRIVSSVQNPFSQTKKDPGASGRVKVVFSYFVQKWIWKNLDHMFPISPGIKEEMIDVYHCSKEKVTLLPNSVDLPCVKKGMSEPQNEINSNVFSIISVGRLVYQKGYDILLDAIKLVSEKQEIQLIILGKGPERDSILKSIKRLRLEKVVKLLGFAPNPWSMIASSDLFVLPSRYEGFGNVLLEAMVCKTPIISTRAPYGPEYILDNGKYGDLVDVENPKALADAINNSIMNIKMKKVRAEEAFSRALEFDASLLSRDFVDNLEKIRS